MTLQKPHRNAVASMALHAEWHADLPEGGIEKGTNGYADKNKIKTVLTPDKVYAGDLRQSLQRLPPPQAAAPSAPATANAAGVTPTWALNFIRSFLGGSPREVVKLGKGEPRP